MKRLFDIFISLILLMFLIIPMMLIALMIKLSSQGTVLYWSSRIGIHNKVFRMPKFRTMKTNTPEVATHLLTDPHKYVTPIGRFLRKYSLDELPQLYSILRGDLSFVGPRPALYNQSDLIALRSENGVCRLRPGITGWAQINGRDELSVSEKVDYDAHYLKSQSFWFDLKILLRTAMHVVKGEGVKH